MQSKGKGKKKPNAPRKNPALQPCSTHRTAKQPQGAQQSSRATGTAAPKGTGITARRESVAGTAPKGNGIPARRGTAPQGSRATGPKGRKAIGPKGCRQGKSQSVHRKNALQGRRMTEGTGTAIPKGNVGQGPKESAAGTVPKGNAADARRATGMAGPKGNAAGTALKENAAAGSKGNAAGVRRATVAAGRWVTGIAVLTRMGVPARRTVLSRKSIK